MTISKNKNLCIKLGEFENLFIFKYHKVLVKTQNHPIVYPNIPIVAVSKHA